eukprot:TRINITY_DN15466_c0_g1_i1.p1 TRINITY_DN15466_c0_g1~~TRINITY_DN15466_c0_g1_i1.p1  ORF type:complete len:497 (+),score=67.99 TRINITY_DN15466_c0_g1_i1:164-1654(+)
MAARGLRDEKEDGWERSDFPILCESCLGDNPYVRMTKAEFDKECKICTRPFTVFRWRPGRDARYKKTEICQTCSKLKNVCQTCLLDLEYGLPVEVRDKALGLAGDSMPQSDVNREFFAEQHEKATKAGLDFESSYGKVRPNDTILKLQRTTPYYKRNRAHICSFFVRGECTRGAECPFRHEMPTTGPLAQQNIKDRYYGVNDPVAAKLLERASQMPSLVPPEDEQITTLYVGGLDDRITEADLKDQFYSYGEIKSIRVVASRGCAFVTFTEREAAEKAAENVANKLVVRGLRLKLMWGRPQQPGPERKEGEPGPPGVASHGGFLPRSVQAPAQQSQQAGKDGEVNYLNFPPPAPAPSTEASYPSMDPEGMGTAVKVPSRDAPQQPGPPSQPQFQQRPPFQQPFRPPPNQNFRPPGQFPPNFQPAPFPYGGGQQGFGPRGPFPPQQGQFMGPPPRFNGPPQGLGHFQQGGYPMQNGGGQRPPGGRGPPSMVQQRPQQ